MGLLGISLKPLKRWWLGERPDDEGLLERGHRNPGVVRVQSLGAPQATQEVFVPQSTGAPGRRRGVHTVRLAMMQGGASSSPLLLLSEGASAQRYDGGDLFVAAPPRWVLFPQEEGKMTLSLLDPAGARLASVAFRFRVNDWVRGETSVAMRMGPAAFAVVFLHSRDHGAAAIQAVHVFADDDS